MVVLQALPVALFSQCIIPPPLEDCNGTEPPLTDNEVLSVGIKKWFYGGTATYNSVTLRGGTLIVCGNLTFNNFTMDSGTVVVRPGAQLHIGGGAGIILRGNAAIYNYGLFECTANLSLDQTWATPAKPNIVVNASTTAFFKMSNQYFVINNPNSYFVNRGRAEFWGLITDYGAGVNSVCLGRFSEMKMAAIYNNRKHTYSAPEGAACVHIFQYSQLRDTLTSSVNVNICLGAGHNADACGGSCRPNAWGTSSVFPFCDACSNITLLRKQGRPLTGNDNNDSGEEELTLSPNPFTGLLTIRWKTGTPRALQVYNLAGRLVFSEAWQRFNGHTFRLQLPASLPGGEYVVKLVYDKKVSIKKVVKIP
jgi:hypothetical protein